MKRYFAVILLLTLVSCLKTSKEAAQSQPAVASAAQTAEHAKLGPLSRKDSDFVEVRAKVQAVNYKRRLITLKGPDGKALTFKVDKAVKRLKEIKVGDTVLAQYFTSFAYEVRKPTAAEKKNPKTVVESAGKSEPGMPPAAAAALRARAIVTIEAIDHAAKTVTVKGPEGRVVTIKAEHPENLKRVKVGDTVAVTYSEAVAVSLEPLKEKRKTK
jgi:hypothetical protein